MKRSFTLAAAIVFAVTAQAFTQVPGAWDLSFNYCGMDVSMARMPRDRRAELARFAEIPQTAAPQLLLFVDMDGAVVAGGFANPTGYVSPLVSGTTTLPAPALTAQQKADIIKLVREDYSPFNVVITTNQADFDSYPTAANKEICIVTTTPTIVGMPAGLTGNSPFNNIGTRLPYNPSFVFSSSVGNDTIAVAATISHEIGHTLGLYHQHLYNESCTAVSEFHPGFGGGRTAFQPLMGAGTAATAAGMFNWFAQACVEPNFLATQDDFALINSQVVLKPDDFPNVLGGTPISARVVNGTFEQAGDVDYVATNLKWRGPVTVTSENVDLKVSAYNGRGELVQTFDDPLDRNVTLPRMSRIRSLKIERAPNPNMPPQFMVGGYVINF
jgi:hypothetical protein